jgi:hypothetical protein
MNGRQVHERLAGFDPIRRVISYQILPPHRLPATDILSTIEVSETAMGTAEVTWRSQAVIGGDAAHLRAAIEAFFSTSLDNLHRLLDRGA